MGTSPSPASFRSPVSLAIGFFFFAHPGAIAQDDPLRNLPAVNLDSLGPLLGDFSPRYGPAGTVVTLRARDMPIEASLRIGVGALRSGFEEVGWILSDEQGGFVFEIVMPSWTRRDVTYHFIVFDPYFAPIALSEVFHVTDPEGRIVREGRLLADGDRCVILRGIDGVRYALAGDDNGWSVGTDVAIEGTVHTPTGCDADAELRVQRVSPPAGKRGRVTIRSRSAT